MRWFLMLVSVLGILGGIGMAALSPIGSYVGPVIILLSIIIAGLSELVDLARLIERSLRDRL